MITSLALLVSSAFAEEPAPKKNPAQTGAGHLAQLTSQPWLKEWKDAKLEDLQLVEPKKDQEWPTGLPAVWQAKIVNPKGDTGYLAWDSDDEGKLVEFAFDADLAVNSPNAKALPGVNAFQQFAIPVKEDKPVASGCVPTAAATVLDYWIRHGYPRWKGDAGDPPFRPLTTRIRARLKMMTIPDKDGYTDDGMSLAGAMPRDLASAIQADADEHQIPVDVAFNRFDFAILQSEVEAKRPVLLSCTVRLPHKLHLSWGHEVAGVGWMKLGDVNFAGISDNFYPVKNSETIRWIRTDAFQSLITIRPKVE